MIKLAEVLPPRRVGAGLADRLPRHRASKLAPKQAAEQMDEQLNLKFAEYRASLGAGK